MKRILWDHGQIYGCSLWVFQVNFPREFPCKSSTPQKLNSHLRSHPFAHSHKNIISKVNPIITLNNLISLSQISPPKKLAIRKYNDPTFPPLIFSFSQLQSLVLESGWKGWQQKGGHHWFRLNEILIQLDSHLYSQAMSLVFWYKIVSVWFA